MTETKRKKLETVRDYAEEKVDKLNKGMRELAFSDASTMVDNKLLLCDMQDECDLWNRVCILVKKDLREWWKEELKNQLEEELEDEQTVK